MNQTLIVARMAPGDAQEVARIFADSDRTELPGLVGVKRRSLFRFHDLYFHLIESRESLGGLTPEIRRHPLFQQVNSELEHFIEPYDPQTWRRPADAMAARFYMWQSADA
ncbi:TcmI family type II polyketide cyclase [Streptomyces canus]|uniref:TcmI family type II polyketide cyclase n=1 Tax=Streptomyces canus TaxID=58343 RepID=UPI0027851D35|nr:TcmI family type II polyketide cyclase [Streptomyces canus]MDQ0762629.1 cyclase [Streptomyces canus]